MKVASLLTSACFLELDPSVLLHSHPFSSLKDLCMSVADSKKPVGQVIHGDHVSTG